MKNTMIHGMAWLALIITAGCGAPSPSQPETGEQAADGSAQAGSAGSDRNWPAQKTIELGEDLALQMVLIPAGSFVMGDNRGLEDEKPAHKVILSKPFYLGQYEVTVEQFRRFVEATHYATDAERGTGFQGAFGWDAATMEFQMNEQYSWRNPGFAQSETDPVVNVSWNDAMEFCKWLSRQEGSTIRLPTEAEWEYACRAGTRTSYSHGDDAEGVARMANVPDAEFQRQFPELESVIQANDGYAYTSPVGTFLPNAFGVYDMHGNVWEWCADWYDAEYYARLATNDPLGPARGEERVYRGGGWFNCARGFRSASRSGDLPENRHLTLGFRVALSPE